MTLLSSICNYFFSKESKFYFAVAKYFILKLIPEISSSESFNYNMMDIMVHRVNKKDKDRVLFTKFQKDLKRNLKRNPHRVDLYKRILTLAIYFCLKMLYIYEITLEFWVEEIPNINIETYSQVTIFKKASFSLPVKNPDTFTEVLYTFNPITSP